eukprot:gnl/Ergobibamus_cyprinoides/1414.p1 GENE.gnl/Ergobibamus_cyprinoides/1414~~gnl/Ergobibamus_cyprinoides/1414.p1  ORF type:complete len:167 (+),score=8.59 gnl/Ergobibamus_cyprinoides/1414:121-621(+)
MAAFAGRDATVDDAHSSGSNASAIQLPPVLCCAVSFAGEVGPPGTMDSEGLPVAAVGLCWSPLEMAGMQTAKLAVRSHAEPVGGSADPDLTKVSFRVVSTGEVSPSSVRFRVVPPEGHLAGSVRWLGSLSQQRDFAPPVGAVGTFFCRRLLGTQPDFASLVRVEPL